MKTEIVTALQNRLGSTWTVPKSLANMGKYGLADNIAVPTIDKMLSIRSISDRDAGVAHAVVRTSQHPTNRGAAARRPLALWQSQIGYLPGALFLCRCLHSFVCAQCAITRRRMIDDR